MANPLTYIGPAIFPNGPGQAAGADNIGGLPNTQAKGLGAVGTAGTQYYDDLIAPIQLTSAASGVSAGGTVQFYVVTGETPTIATGPWTNNIDPNSNLDQSAKLTGLTAISPGLAMHANNTVYVFREFSIYGVLGYMPTYWSIIVLNQSGAALPVTSGANHVIRHSYLIAGAGPGTPSLQTLTQPATYADTGEAYYVHTLAGTGVARAFDFYSKFGVNGNLDSGGTLAQEQADMAYIGINNIRSSVYNANQTEVVNWFKTLAVLAASGVRQHIELQAGGGVPFNSMADWIGALKTYIVGPYGAQMVTGVCGPNETNIQYFAYSRPGGVINSFNPYWRSPLVTLSNGNRTATHTGAAADTLTAGLGYHSSGSFTYSVTFPTLNGTNEAVGFIVNPSTSSTYIGSDTNSLGLYSSGTVVVNGAVVGNTGVAAWSSGTIIDVAVTITASTSVTLWVRKRGGTWNNNAANSPGGAGGVTVTGLAAYTIAPAIDILTTGDVATVDFTTDLGITGFAPWASVASDAMSGIIAANTVQGELYAAIKADPMLSSIPVDMWPVALIFRDGVPSQIGDMTAFCDRGNLHDYYSADNFNQFNPEFNGDMQVALQQYLVHGRQISNRQHFITTETGWYTPEVAGDSQGCNEYTQARLLLNDLFDHAMLPYYDEVYLFTLRGGSTPPDLSDYWYGVIHDDGTPKISGTAIRNLIQIIQDTGPNAATFSPGPLSYSLSGMPAASGSFVIGKSNGHFLIILWNETPIWNTGAAVGIPIASSSVVVQLPGAMSGSVFDPINGGSTAISTFTGASVTVSLNDAPLIIDVGPVASSANLVTGVSTANASILSNYGFPLGFAFTVGSQPITVTALGRYKVLAGDHLAHTLYILDPNNVQPNAIYPVVATATVNITAAPVNTFTYGNLATPVTLPAGSTYYLVSTEAPNTDSWYDQGLTVTTTGAASVITAVYMQGPAFNQNPNIIGGQFHAYVPLDFQYNVGMAPPPTIPKVINFAPPSPVTVADNQKAGAVVNTITVTMSDASSFTGTLGFAPPNMDAGGLVTITGNTTLTLTRDLRAADDGNKFVTISATANATTITNNLTLAIAASAPPIPTAIIFAPPSPAPVYDNSAINTVVNTVSVTMSDPSAFSGTLNFAAPNFDAGGLVRFTGNTLTLTRGLNSPADDGNKLVTVSAQQGATTISNSLTLNVAPPPVGANFITSVPVGNIHSNYPFPLGFSFTVGSSPITVTALGRYKVQSGDNQTHTLYLLDPTIVDPGGLLRVVPGAMATVNIASAAVNTFTYGNVITPTTLLAGHTYYIISTETNPGDGWYDAGSTTVTTTGDALLNSGIFITGPAFNQNPSGNGGQRQPYVPLDFKYSIGATAVLTVQGGPGVQGQAANNVQARYSPNLTPGGNGCVVSGTITINGFWVNGGPELGLPGIVVTGQWMRDNEVPLSPPIDSTGALISGGGFDRQPGWFTYTFDTHTIPDGTHSIYCRIIDSGTTPAPLSCYQWGSMATPLIVWNSGGASAPVSSGQTIYTAQYSIGPRPQVPKPDSIVYGGVPNPVATTYPYPYALSAPASARGGDPARFRDITQIAAEALNAPRDGEYLGPPEFATTQVGGVFVQHLDPLVDSPNNAGTYNYVVRQNAPSGTRLNNQVSNISTYVEAPTWLAGAAAWLGCSVEGRLYITDRFGNTTTLAGFERNRAVLTLDASDTRLVEDQITRTLIGTFPAGVDLGGAVDLVVDPRNNHVVYVLSQLDNWLAKVTLTGTSVAAGVTAVVTVYAGSPGAADGYHDGPAASALFAQPTALAIVGTVGNTAAPNGDPVGTIYISDWNSAIRKISFDGATVSTMYGGTVGPPPPAAMLISINPPPSFGITSLSWSASGGGTATVVAPAPGVPGVVGIGCTVGFSGAVNAGTVNINNSGAFEALPKFYVNGFTDSQHFTVAMPGVSGVQFIPGPFTGTITIYSYSGVFTAALVATTGLQWSAGSGGTAHVTTVSPVTGVFAVGCTVGFTGAVNTGSANINFNNNDPSSIPKFKVIAFTSNTDFVIAMPGTSDQYGTFSGNITVYSFAIDVYSPPGTVSLLGPRGYTSYPGFIRWSSQRHLILSEFWSDNARDIDLLANTIRRIGTFDDRIEIADTTPGTWMGMDVDFAGVFGPVDDIILAKFQSNASAAHYVWRLSLDGAYSQQGFSDFGSLPTIGQSSTLLAGPGHYPWAWSFSRTEGRAISSGSANHPPSFHRIMEAGDIPVNLSSNQNIDFQKWTNGDNIWTQGTVTKFPWSARPGFVALWGFWGDGHVLGLTWDDLMHGTYASVTPGDTGDVNLANYIRSGMGGSVPRPEITGNDMRDLIYFIRRNTMQGSGLIGGAPLVVPGPDDPNVVPPLITALSAVHNGTSGGFASITVTWTTNTPCIGLAMACSASQLGQPWPYNIPSPIESGPLGTSHTATVSGIKGGTSPVYYVAIAKDNAGHCVYSSVQSVTSSGGGGGGLTADGSFIQAPASGNTGAAAGSVRTAYGTFTFGDLFAPVPHYGGGQFYIPLLNGVPLNPSYFYIWSQFFFVGYGGQLFSTITSDQLLAGWSNNSWNGDNGGNGPGPFTGFPGSGSASQIPIGVPTPPPLPTQWAGPYTPSAPGTSLALGAAGTLISARGDGGHWTFGAASGGGWVLMREGIPVSTTNSGSWAPTIVTHMQINANGSLFFQLVDGTWRVWNCHQPNPATGPVAGPIPVMVNFTPPMPAIPLGSAVGTLVTNVITTMSDGSTFSGTISVGLDTGNGPNTGLQTMRARGNTAIELNLTYAGAQAPVTVTQNGCALVTKLNAQ